jgi:proteasome accessory factor B
MAACRRETIHGEWVAFGLLVRLVLGGEFQDDVPRLLAFCRSVGLPTRCADFGLDDPPRAVLLAEAARIAVPHVIQARAAHDVERRMRAEMVLAVLEGRGSAEESTVRLGFASAEPFSLLAFEFADADPALGEPQRRRLEPWGVVNRHGRWYVAGHDQARDAVRVFRLSRIEGQVGFSGPRGAVKVPDGIDLRELVAEWDSHPAEQQAAALKIRAGTGFGLRRRATREQPGSDGWDLVEVPFSDAAWFAEHIASFGADVLVTGPADLRDAVITRLKGALA